METGKNDKYYGLRLISYICKIFTILIAIIGIGIIGADTIRILNLSPRPDNATLFQLWIRDALVVLLVAGMMGFLFFIISQIIDVQMAINIKLNTIVDLVNTMDTATQTASKTEIPIDQTDTHHQEIMQKLERQNRILIKLYKDTVADSDSADDSISTSKND